MTVTGTASSGVVDGAQARGLARPTVLETLRALATVAGGVGALELWSQAAAATGAHGMDLDLQPHIDAVNWLAEHGPDPATRTVTNSIAARLRVYRVLSAMEGDSWTA